MFDKISVKANLNKKKKDKVFIKKFKIKSLANVKDDSNYIDLIYFVSTNFILHF